MNRRNNANPGVAINRLLHNSFNSHGNQRQDPAGNLSGNWLWGCNVSWSSHPLSTFFPAGPNMPEPEEQSAQAQKHDGARLRDR